VQPNKYNLVTLNSEKAILSFDSTPVQITAGSRFLGGFIGNTAHFTAWLTAGTPNQCHHYSCFPVPPFSLYWAPEILQHLADLVANKQQQTYSAIMKLLRLRIDITLVKAVHHCLRGSRKRHQQPSSRFTSQNPIEPSLEYMLHS
jgi:hypothetical protein